MTDFSWEARQTAWKSWVTVGSGLDAKRVVWGQQDGGRPQGPAIIMRISNLAEVGMNWLDTEDNPLTFADNTVVADATVNTFTCANHGLETGDGPVQLTTTGTLPGGLALETDYWIVKVDANTFKLSATFESTGGKVSVDNTNPITTIDVVDAGVGTHTVVAGDGCVRAGAELRAVARGVLRVTLELRCHGQTGDGSAGVFGSMTPTAILQKIRTRQVWPSQSQRLKDVNTALVDIARVQAILGARDALLFEPRAMMDVHFAVPVEEGEDLTIIAKAVLTNQTTSRTWTEP